MPEETASEHSFMKCRRSYIVDAHGNVVKEETCEILIINYPYQNVLKKRNRDGQINGNLKR